MRVKRSRFKNIGPRLSNKLELVECSLTDGSEVYDIIITSKWGKTVLHCMSIIDADKLLDAMENTIIEIDFYPIEKNEGGDVKRQATHEAPHKEGAKAFDRRCQD